MSLVEAHAPTQAAEFSGPGKRAIVLYAPELAGGLLEVLGARPEAYEAHWRYHEERRAHVLTVEFATGHRIGVALVDGIHNAVIALLARGAAMVLSPYPIYAASEAERPEALFSPETSLALPSLPSPLGG